MLKQLFRTKNIEKLVADAAHDDVHGVGLKRVLTLKDLTFFGIAAIIGAGSFSSLGEAIFKGGPGVMILFIICGVACGFTALCYAEFASRIPVAGSAYTYAYASFGELFAWIIGWALIMEYSIGNIYVAYSWSDYFTSLLSKLHIHLPDYLTSSYMEVKKAIADGTTKTAFVNAWNQAPQMLGIKFIIDLPAFIINILITYLVYIGVKESRNFSNAMVILKLAVVILVILVGAQYIISANWQPVNDAGVKSFMPNGFAGVMSAVSGVFFAYIGFDAISVMGEESKNPQRDLPRSMLLSLVICTVIYILLTLVLTGALNYTQYENVGDPLAKIFEANGNDWMQFLVSICAVIAITSVLLVFQLGQPRIWMSMSRDGLMPKKFAEIHPKYNTPKFATIITGLVVGIPLLFTDRSFILDFTSIGTLFAFVLVCGGVLLLPRKQSIKGRFNMPYIAGQYIFPVLVISSIAIVHYYNNTYFANLTSTQLSNTEKADYTKQYISDNAAIFNTDNFTIDQYNELFKTKDAKKSALAIALLAQVYTNTKIAKLVSTQLSTAVHSKVHTLYSTNNYNDTTSLYTSVINANVLMPAITDSITTYSSTYTFANNNTLDSLILTPYWNTDLLPTLAYQKQWNQTMRTAALNNLDTIIYSPKNVSTLSGVTYAQLNTNIKAETLKKLTSNISLLVFWLICIVLAIFAFIKKWSLIPILGLVSCLYLLTGMAANNWKWFAIWFGIGIVIYFLYGYKKSKLNT